MGHVGARTRILRFKLSRFRNTVLHSSSPRDSLASGTTTLLSRACLFQQMLQIRTCRWATPLQLKMKCNGMDREGWRREGHMAVRTPSQQFYPTDWINDIDGRTVESRSAAALLRKKTDRKKMKIDINRWIKEGLSGGKFSKTIEIYFWGNHALNSGRRCQKLFSNGEFVRKTTVYYQKDTSMQSVINYLFSNINIQPTRWRHHQLTILLKMILSSGWRFSWPWNGECLKIDEW